MLTAKQFAAKWGDDLSQLVRFPNRAFTGLTIPVAEKRFLVEAGLPEGAAPCLSFECPETGTLPTVAKLFNQPKSLARYRTIGADGAGNPIALDRDDKFKVVLLDHENAFARVHMNAAIRQLAECLLAYRDMVEATNKVDEGAFAEGRVPKPVVARLRRKMKLIDPSAVEAGCFWSREIDCLNADVG